MTDKLEKLAGFVSIAKNPTPLSDELPRDEGDFSLAVPRKEKFNPLSHQKRWLNNSNEKMIIMKVRNPNSLMSANNPSKPPKI